MNYLTVSYWSQLRQPVMEEPELPTYNGVTIDPTAYKWTFDVSADVVAALAKSCVATGGLQGFIRKLNSGLSKRTGLWALTMTRQQIDDLDRYCSFIYKRHGDWQQRLLVLHRALRALLYEVVGTIPPHGCWVYCWLDTSANELKLGKSIHPGGRKKAYATHNPRDLVLIGQIYDPRGTPDRSPLEHELKLRFKHLKTNPKRTGRQEWFSNHPEIHDVFEVSPEVRPTSQTVRIAAAHYQGPPAIETPRVVRAKKEPSAPIVSPYAAETLWEHLDNE